MSTSDKSIFFVETPNTVRTFAQARPAWAAFHLMKQQNHSVTLIVDSEFGRITLARHRIIPVARKIDIPAL